MRHPLPSEAPVPTGTVLDASPGAVEAALQWLEALPPAAPEPQPKRPRRRRRPKVGGD